MFTLFSVDLLFTGNIIEFIQYFKDDMKQVFEMLDLGETSYFFGMKVEQKNGDIFIYQMKYENEMLNKFNMENCKILSNLMCPKSKLYKNDEAGQVDETLYGSLIGCLMYLTTTRFIVL